VENALAGIYRDTTGDFEHAPAICDCQRFNLPLAFCRQDKQIACRFKLLRYMFV
jgi:hypothetical protein